MRGTGEGDYMVCLIYIVGHFQTTQAVGTEGVNTPSCNIAKVAMTVSNQLKQINDFLP